MDFLSDYYYSYLFFSLKTLLPYCCFTTKLIWIRVFLLFFHYLTFTYYLVLQVIIANSVQNRNFSSVYLCSHQKWSYTSLLFLNSWWYDKSCDVIQRPGSACIRRCLSQHSCRSWWRCAILAAVELRGLLVFPWWSEASETHVYC